MHHAIFYIQEYLGNPIAISALSWLETGDRRLLPHHGALDHQHRSWRNLVPLPGDARDRRGRAEAPQAVGARWAGVDLIELRMATPVWRSIPAVSSTA